MRLQIVVLVMLCACLNTSVNGQGSADAARYFDQNIFGNGFTFNSAGSMSLHGMDYSSVIYNPATSALAKKSSAGFAMNGVFGRSKSDYLSNTTVRSESEFNLSTINTVFKIPTSQGSLVFSAGYVQSADFSDNYMADGKNLTNSISDFLAKAANADIRFAAYNGYAVDSVRNGTSDLQSILRFSNFNGINQFVQQNQTGRMGEFIINGATEFQKNFFIGFTVGIPVGTYSYEKIFLEEDLNNDYSAFQLDVSSILVTENVRAEMTGIYAKLGLLYKATDFLNLGLSYQSGYDLEVNENYSYRVFTTYDDGFTPSDEFPFRLEGDFTYRIENPAILQAGVSVVDLHGLDLGLTVEYRNYNGIRFSLPTDYVSEEIGLNRDIQNEFKDVLNVSAGVGYRFGNIKTQAGVAYLPDYRTDSNTNRYIINVGSVIDLSDRFEFNLGLSYRGITGNQFLYSTADYGDNPTFENKQQWFTSQVGIKLKF
jgi:hypothetical protein